MKLNHSIAAYQCALCDECFESPKKLRQHFIKHSMGPTSKSQIRLNSVFETCIVCGSKISEMKMDNHLCVQGESVSCEYCSREFISIKLILKHLEGCHDGQMYSCKECPQSFRMQTLMDRHRKYHTRELMEFVCMKCSQSFPCAESLEHHASFHANEESEMHLCELCGKSFSRSCNLESHLKTHGERIYKCIDCPARFKFRRYLIRHSKIHSKIKEKCNVCGVIMYPKVLRIHMRELFVHDLMVMFD